MRATILVLDSFGVGAMPDAADWGDAGSDTLGHVAEVAGGLQLPHLQALGLGNIHPAPGLPPADRPLAAWGRMAIASDGKDTIAGHWEMAGFPVDKRFRDYPDGFPPALVAALEQAFDRPILGNYAASGTAILDRLGAEHLATGRPIVYTSADSVLQIAAHEQVVPLEQLYDWSRRAFELVQPYDVVRVIARPFLGAPGAFVRTGNRKDFARQPGGPTLMDHLQRAGHPCTSVGKIASIYGHRGFDRDIKAAHNPEILQRTLDALDEQPHGLVFANLVDLDMLYGHRRDPVGYKAALQAIDARVPELLERMGHDDLLCFIADHGCDPTHPGTDHTREYVPILVYRKGGKGSGVGTRASLADLAATLCDWFDVPPVPHGTSFAGAL